MRSFVNEKGVVAVRGFVSNLRGEMGFAMGVLHAALRSSLTCVGGAWQVVMGAF